MWYEDVFVCSTSMGLTVGDTTYYCEGDCEDFTGTTWDSSCPACGHHAGERDFNEFLKEVHAVRHYKKSLEKERKPVIIQYETTKNDQSQPTLYKEEIYDGAPGEAFTFEKFFHDCLSAARDTNKHKKLIATAYCCASDGKPDGFIERRKLDLETIRRGLNLWYGEHDDSTDEEKAEIRATRILGDAFKVDAEDVYVAF